MMGWVANSKHSPVSNPNKLPFVKNKEQQYKLYLYSLLFILANAVAMYAESYLFALLPFVFLVILFSFFALDKVIMIIFALIPLSLPFKEFFPSSPVDFYLPTEPLLVGVLFLFISNLAIEKKFDKAILIHPISIVIYIYLGWLIITSITSTMPVVSFKYLLVRIWFIAGFYFLMTQLFKDSRRFDLIPLLYALPMLLVIGYAIYNHQLTGLFDKNAAHFVMRPFYNDHTSYGAALAMLLPVLIGLATHRKYTQNQKLFLWLLVGIFAIATILSYTRAAWLSLFAIFGIWLIIRLKIRPVFIVGVAVILLTVITLSWSDIKIKLSQNKQDSSENISEHLQSMSNIQTDASNLERLNRWNSAFRMFHEKPIFGWGPGTYMFKYASYQMSYEKTIISTNAGDMGNAHSEYIGPLAESGVLGSLTYLLLISTILLYGFKVYRKLEDKEAKTMALAFTLSLMTYFLHGFLNNFLDTDKIAGPFWAFTAGIVALDVYHAAPSSKNN